MAKKLREFTKTENGKRTMYPWPIWLDGSIYRLKRGEDFTCKLMEGFRNLIYVTARRRGGRVRIDTVDEDTLEIQFRNTEEAK